MGAEWISPPDFDGDLQFFREAICNHLLKRLHRLRLVILYQAVMKRLSAPVAPGNRAPGRARRIEDKMEPTPGLFETLIRSQLGRNQQGNVEEQLPVVEFVCATRLKLYFVHGVCFQHARFGLVVNIEGPRVLFALRIKRQERGYSSPVESLLEVAQIRVMKIGEGILPRRPEDRQKGLPLEFRLQTYGHHLARNTLSAWPRYENSQSRCARCGIGHDAISVWRMAIGPCKIVATPGGCDIRVHPAAKIAAFIFARRAGRSDHEGPDAVHKEERTV